jgi:hypothetical protein
MSTESDELRAWRQAFAAPGPPPAPEDCPPPERIWAALRGELAADEIRDVVDHTALCASCAEDWRLAAALLAEEPAEATVVEPRRATRPAVMPERRRMRGWQVRAASLAAAAMVLLAVGIQWRGDDGGAPASFREGVQSELRSLVESDSLPRDSFRLRWSPAGEGATYDLQVSTEKLDQVAAASDLIQPWHRVPPDKLAHLPAGTRLLWRVEATLPDGRSLESETFLVTLR